MKKIILLVLLIMTLMICTSCFLKSYSDTNVSKNDSVSSELRNSSNDNALLKAIGNTNYNISVGGLVVSSPDSKDIFFRNPNGNNGTLCKLDKDGKVIPVISDWPESLNISQDGYIYYINLKDHFIYRVKDDGSEKEPIVKDSICYSLIIQNNKLYYSTGAPQEAIYSSDLNGHNKKKLIDTPFTKINIDNGRIYYLKNKDLYSMNLNGEDVKPEVKNLIRFFVQDGKIYYIPNNIDAKGFYSFYKIDKKGINTQIFSGMEFYMTDNSNCFFAKPNTAANNLSLYQTDLDGKNEKLIANNIMPDSQGMGIANNIFILFWKSEYKVISIN